MRVWDVDSGEPVGEALTGHTDGMFQVNISEDGSRVASMSRDETVQLWNIDLRRCEKVLDHNNGEAMSHADAAAERFLNGEEYAEQAPNIHTSRDYRTLAFNDNESGNNQVAAFDCGIRDFLFSVNETTAVAWLENGTVAFLRVLTSPQK